MIFSKEFYKHQYSNVLVGRSEISENMKILLYRLIPEYFELLDFDDEDIFLEPLLFAYFHLEINDIDVLKQIMYGSIASADRPKELTVKSNRYGNIYMPRLGWVTNVEKGKKFKLENIDNKYYLDGNSIEVEPIHIGNKLGIEVVKHPIEMMDDRFYDASKNIIDVNVEDAFTAFVDTFDNSINYIHDNVGWLAALIKKSCFKSVIFDDYSDPIESKFCKRNSFASLRVKCISFHNVYQPWYNEVFFLDDISHQMGHVIFTLLTNNTSRFYKVDPKAILKSNSEYGKRIDLIEDRNYEVIFHALYTYFLTLNILDAALESNHFNDDQVAEIKGRIAFYMRKCTLDFELFEDFDKSEIAERIYTPEGLYIYMNMKQTFALIYKKYQSIATVYNFDNQSYNYNHKKFLEVNSTLAGVSA